MKILITGGKGMLGRTLQKTWQKTHTLMCADLPEVDILSTTSLVHAFHSFKPDVVIHCAAMTQVDACEQNPDRAFLLNEVGSRHVAEAARAQHARLIAISTDYVFSGEGDTPWREDDTPHPKTVYGQSKYAGEQAILACDPSATLVRTAWLYGPGGPSFIHTMRALGEKEGAPLRVVNDQKGNPTSTQVVADVLTFLLAHPETHGPVHATCEGICSWYELTVELFRRLHLMREVRPCTTEEFPRPAPRPHFSALAKTVLAHMRYATPTWQNALATFLMCEEA